MLPANPSNVGKPLWLIAIISCLVGFLLLIVVALLAFVLYIHRVNQSLKLADETARQFLQFVQRGQYDQAYAMTSSNFQHVSSSSEVKTFAALWQQGEVKSLDLRSNSWDSGVGNREVTLVYGAHGSHHDGEVFVVVVPVAKTFRVESFHFAPLPPPSQP